MKTKIRFAYLRLVFISALTLGSLTAMADEFHFKFTYQGESWALTQNAEKWTVAFEKASQECLNHFARSSGNKKIKVDEATADALLYTCANPR